MTKASDVPIFAEFLSSMELFFRSKEVTENKAKVMASGCLSTIKEISKDGENSMVEEERPVLNYDRVMEHYTKALHLTDKPGSTDGLLFQTGAVPLFIEFKNGKIDKKERQNIVSKLCPSVLTYLDITGTRLEDLRNHAEFILVYNAGRNQANPALKEKNSCALDAPSLDLFASSTHRWADEEYIAFGLERFQGYTFKSVHTYTVPEFTGFLENNCAF